jgi:8-oxo-dGTP diphosphatase
MKTYSLGFAISNDVSSVLLIKKIKPEWQRGKFNGIGGSIENCDNGDYLNCMVREFMEETGVISDRENWHYVIEMCTPTSWSVMVYAIFMDITKARTITEEEVVIVPISSLLTRNDVIPNLRWLVPMCINGSEGLKRVEYK